MNGGVQGRGMNFRQQKSHLCQWVNENKDLQDNQ